MEHKYTTLKQRKNLWNLRLTAKFLNMIPKAWARQGKTPTNWTSSKLKLCAVKPMEKNNKLLTKRKYFQTTYLKKDLHLEDAKHSQVQLCNCI